MNADTAERGTEMNADTADIDIVLEAKIRAAHATENSDFILNLASEIIRLRSELSTTRERCDKIMQQLLLMRGLVIQHGRTNNYTDADWDNIFG